LTWSAPLNDGGAPVTYDLWYDDVPPLSDGCADAQWENAWEGSTTATSITVGSLVDGTFYCFRVTARNSGGSSAPAFREVWPGRAAAPAACALTAEFWPDQGGGGDWELTVTWNMPAHDGGYPLIGYTVEWYDGVLYDHEDFVQVSSPRLAYWSQVPPGHTYWARVHAWNEELPGQRCVTNQVDIQ
jgi:hypothetical protein